MLLIVALYFLLPKTEEEIEREQARTPSPTLAPGEPLIQENLSPTPTIPSEQLLKISGVEVNNFKKSAVKISPEGDVLIADSPNYQISYIAMDELFIISINSSPFDKIRLDAEAEFLRQLDISESTACSLNVQESTPRFANPELAGQSFGPSFCEQN